MSTPLPRRDRPGFPAQPRPEGRGAGRTLAWRVVGFVALFAVLQSIYGAAKGSWLERLVIDHATVRTAAWLIDAVDPAAGVVPAGSRLRAAGGGINIINGCDGTDVMFLLVAAMLVAPLPLRARCGGAVAGVAIVFALNQARVVALFYAYRSDRALFEMLHGIVTPLLLVAAASAFFAIWLDRHAGADRAGLAAGGA